MLSPGGSPPSFCTAQASQPRCPLYRAVMLPSVRSLPLRSVCPAQGDRSDPTWTHNRHGAIVGRRAWSREDSCASPQTSHSLIDWLQSRAALGQCPVLYLCPLARDIHDVVVRWTRTGGTHHVEASRRKHFKLINVCTNLCVSHSCHAS